MASIKISGLEETTAASDVDTMALERSDGKARRIAISVLAKVIASVLKINYLGGVSGGFSHLGLDGATATLDDVIAAMPPEISLFSVWVSDSFALRAEINTAIGRPNVFGQVYVLRTGATYHIAYSLYNISDIYINKYSAVNSFGYSGWKKLTLEDV